MDLTRPLFVISFCDGIGAVFIALEALQIAFRGLASEQDEQLGSFVARKFPTVTHQSDCLKLEADKLRGPS